MLIQYLTGTEGMTNWTEGGVAIPSRKDVAGAAGSRTSLQGADYAKPGSGFMPG